MVGEGRDAAARDDRVEQALVWQSRCAGSVSLEPPSAEGAAVDSLSVMESSACTRRNVLTVHEFGDQRTILRQRAAISLGRTCTAAKIQFVRLACVADDVAGSEVQSSTSVKGPSVSLSVCQRVDPSEGQLFVVGARAPVSSDGRTDEEARVEDGVEIESERAAKVDREDVLALGTFDQVVEGQLQVAPERRGLTGGRERTWTEMSWTRSNGGGGSVLQRFMKAIEVRRRPLEDRWSGLKVLPRVMVERGVSDARMAAILSSSREPLGADWSAARLLDRYKRRKSSSALSSDADGGTSTTGADETLRAASGQGQPIWSSAAADARGREGRTWRPSR